MQPGQPGWGDQSQVPGPEGSGWPQQGPGPQGGNPGPQSPQQPWTGQPAQPWTGQPQQPWTGQPQQAWAGGGPYGQPPKKPGWSTGKIVLVVVGSTLGVLFLLGILAALAIPTLSTLQAAEDTGSETVCSTWSTYVNGVIDETHADPEEALSTTLGEVASLAPQAENLTIQDAALEWIEVEFLELSGTPVSDTRYAAAYDDFDAACGDAGYGYVW